jgi:putative ABC transport system permease protein
MYAAVDGRRREIAMLRTIGFSRAAIMLSFVLESLLICALACGVGLAGSVALSGTQQDFLSDTTWTVLAYRLQITPGIAATALLAAALVGVAGALAPAVRAARTNILQAMRKG